ncbi:MAG: UDP-N-acetylglucosamine pyrophosphorylase [Acutalibacteraceae bacterium]
MEKLMPFNCDHLLDTSHTIAKKIFEKINYPWEILALIKDFIKEFGPTLPLKEYEQISENVWVSKKATIFPSAHIEGPTIIQEGAQIRHCAFIRGSAIVGKNCVVGNSTELKNVILFDNVQVPHFNYVGDSILGYKAHMGAGSITSNVKSDKSLISVKFQGEKIETNLKKFGAILGDGVEIGCNAVLNPGTIIGRNSTVYPTSMVRGVIEENSILKNNGKIVKKI